MLLKKDQKGYRLSFENGLQLHVRLDGKDYGGVGDVRLRRRKLRSAELPILPLIGTPDGYEVSRLVLEDLEKTPTRA